MMQNKSHFDQPVGEPSPKAPEVKTEPPPPENPAAVAERDKALGIVAAAFERANKEANDVLAKRAFWQKMKDSMWQDISYP
jgi:hypothetical protein